VKHTAIILRLALPSIVSFATVTLTGTINLIMVGQLGALVIAVVGVSNIVMYNLWGLFSGIGHTVNYLVAQNYGENDMRRGIVRTYAALYICGAVALLDIAAGLLAPAAVLRFMGAAPELVDAGTEYLRLRFFATAFGTMSFMFHGFFRGIGDTRTPMIYSIAGNAVMVFFTYTLTYGRFGFPELGLTGAGLAVLLGEAAGLLGCLYVFFIRLHPRFHTRILAVPERPEVFLLVQESGKLGLQEFAMSMAMFVFTMFVTRLGTDALAANEVALNVMALGFMPAFAFGSTATILVGQEIGKGTPLAARRYGTETAVLGSVFLLLLGTVEFFRAEPIAHIYSADPAVYRAAAGLIMISAFLQLFDGLLNFYAGCLRGIGDTTFLLKASLVLNWLLFIPLAYLLTFVFHLGGAGAWIALYTFLAAFGISVMVRFYLTDWSRVAVKRARSGANAELMP
jgi:putative MATE family efflux protein